MVGRPVRRWRTSRSALTAGLGAVLLITACGFPAPVRPTRAAPVSAPPPEEPANAAVLTEVEPGRHFDVAILGGRVMDPETGLDLVANVGVDGGTVAAITLQPIGGRTEIDASGHVVAPGFIDLLSYAPNTYGVWYKVGDGVTTNLGMHGLEMDAAPWFEKWGRAHPPTNYGGGFS